MKNRFENILLLFIIPIIIFSFYFILVFNDKIAERLGGLGASISFITALATYYYVVYTVIMVKEIVRSNEEEAKPNIIVNMEIDEKKDIYLIITNNGKKIAKNLTISINPSMDENGITDGIFKNAIPYFAPGASIKTVITDAQHFLKQNNNKTFIFYFQYEWGKQRKEKEEHITNWDHLNTSFMNHE